MVLAFVVDDVAEAYVRFQTAGIPIVMPMRDEPWGQRRFVAQDPAGVLVELLQVVGPAASEFLGQDQEPAEMP
jgi:uncharacterized glyoxalase superfamily protein PhnB